MNKSFIKSGLVVLAALVLASCSKTDEFQHNPDSALQIESVSGISPFDLMQNQPSKAVITGKSLPGDEAAKGIGLFVTASNGSAYDGHDSGYTNVKYAYSSTKWSATSPIYLSNTTGNLYGYFPYNADATDLHAIPVESSLNGTDYLYANPMTVNHSEKNVTLQMNHALSRLHLTIKKGKNFTADASLSKITLKSTAIDATGTMDLTTGVITASKKSGETGIVELATDGKITAQGIEKDILIVPADGTEGKKDIAIILTIGGKLASVSLSGENGIDIRSGIQNNVILTIEDTGIKVTGVDVGVWGEGGSQEVQVSGHKVTVKLSNDAADAEISGDVLSLLQVNGSDLSIDTYSKMGKPVVLRMNGTSLGPDTESGNLCTFTISDITSDIIATLAYAKTRTVSVNVAGVDKAPNVSGYVYGKAEPITVIEGRPSILTAIPGEGYAVDYFNVKGTKYSDKAEVLIPDDVETIDAYFRFSDCLSGVFTVSDDGKGNVRKVRFSRGNLWFGPNLQATNFNFETNQYDSTPSFDNNRDENHISHFFWCKNAELARYVVYLERETTSNDNLFTNASPTEPNGSFAVNGQKGFWRALSGGDSGEWKYLIERKDSEGNALYKLGVTVCGRSNCLVLLPDDWEWDANTVGAGWQTEYSESTTVKWSTMEASGAVCLPAAGFRNGTPGIDNPALVFGVGSYGYYLSASTDDNSSAYDLNFHSGDVSPSGYTSRDRAYSVRLVTEVQ